MDMPFFYIGNETSVTTLNSSNGTCITTNPTDLLLHPVPETERLVTLFIERGKLDVWKYVWYCPPLMTNLWFAHLATLIPQKRDFFCLKWQLYWKWCRMLSVGWKPSLCWNSFRANDRLISVSSSTARSSMHSSSLQLSSANYIQLESFSVFSSCSMPILK